MEVLQPAEIAPPQDNSGIPKDFLDAGINFKNVQFLDNLGLRDEMFNPNVMDKIQFIADKVADVDLLEDISLRLGNDNSIPKIDKIYSYLKLIEQSEIMREKKDLIDNQIQRYESD